MDWSLNKLWFPFLARLKGMEGWPGESRTVGQGGLPDSGTLLGPLGAFPAL